MPKATPETLQSDPRVARAILSAPYPLASIRTRPYIIFRPIHPPGAPGQSILHPGTQQNITFAPNAPFFYGGLPGSHSPLPASCPEGRPMHSGGMAGWPLPFAVPALQPAPQIQTEGQRVAAEQLSAALRSPMVAAEAAPGSMASTQGPGPLQIAHEMGKFQSGGGGSATPKGPPQSLNLLTSTFQTILPRSLLDYRQMSETLITPPVLTSSTTFYTGVTAGGGETPRPSPTTPVIPARRGTGPISPPKGRKYGQRERESSGEESDGGWSSDATVTKRQYRSPMSPRLETPSTPRPLPSRLSKPHHSPSVRKIKCMAKGKGKPTPPAPLFLGQTNLSPFTYDLSRRRRPSGSGSTMSLIGFESDATNTTVIRVPRSFLKQREGRYGPGGGGLFYKADAKDKGKARMGRVEEEQVEMARQRPQTPLLSSPGYLAPFGPRLDVQDPSTPRALHPAAPPAPPSPERPYSPQPISIDPQSAHFANPTPSWPHPPQPAYPADTAQPMGVEEMQTEPAPSAPHRSQLPFTKACHNFLLVRHRQAARRRRLLLDYHRRVKAEAEAEDEEEAMVVDTPAVPTFAASQQQHSMEYTEAAQQPYQQPLPYHSPVVQPQVADRHEVAIRNIATIARVELDDGKPARKRRRDLSPESAYHPAAVEHRYAPGYSGFQQLHQSPRLSHQAHSPSSLPPRLSFHANNQGPSAPSTSLLPSVEIRTPPTLSATHHIQARPRSALPQMPGATSVAADVVRISAGPYGHFEFERGRAEEMDRRLMEEMKAARRDAWLQESGGRRGGYSKGRR